MFSAPLYYKWRIQSPASSNMLLITSSVFFILIGSFYDFDVLFMLTIYLLKFSLSSLSIFITSVLYSADCLLPFHLVLFLEISSFVVFLCETCFFASSFWLPLCVCLYVLGRFVMFPSLGRLT